MSAFRLLRLPLLTLVLLATLLMTSSAFAAKPVVKEVKAVDQNFASYMDMSGGGCMHDQMSVWDD